MCIQVDGRRRHGPKRAVKRGFSKVSRAGRMAGVRRLLEGPSKHESKHEGNEKG